ncbi:hypothetical protein T310_10116 [Rasamsonia emersonii CBS 393.64]|uniref:Uncharacterized protein n=1 Tax=Rasamsonia emersonii (strain ATCC 16479 / CBS 393.64 / IMI 116815) TaxID=1408163 RepID=A0A0F4YF87_RASE3|nr:hypothetical protein T310_10116 [Rasamsonia emersonii CBS 393.64]KKA16298.1 hypothetical protein T310_10116 [Rasamsonia emersonii CBS 393.64]
MTSDGKVLLKLQAAHTVQDIRDDTCLVVGVIRPLQRKRHPDHGLYSKIQDPVHGGNQRHPRTSRNNCYQGIGSVFHDIPIGVGRIGDGECHWQYYQKRSQRQQQGKTALGGLERS